MWFVISEVPWCVIYYTYTVYNTIIVDTGGIEKKNVLVSLTKTQTKTGGPIWQNFALNCMGNSREGFKGSASLRYK